MKAPSYFNDFLSNIRLTDSQRSDLKTGHETLRKRLNSDEELSGIIVSTFLQGSYRRSTAIKPNGDSRADVDVIVVTTLDKEQYTPDEALHIFDEFLEKYYSGKYRIQGRSIGITLSYVDLDIVITSAPSESQKDALKSLSILSEYTIQDMLDISNSKITVPSSIFASVASMPQWKMEPLWIPDREAKIWERTHPLAQIQWTVDKNKNCNSHYINVVKALKWWKKEKYPDLGHPKSYPFEHLIGQCCPDNISSIAEGVTLSLEQIVDVHQIKPYLPDHGVLEHDVFKRITESDYDIFYDAIFEAAEIARAALDEDDLTTSVNKWRELFGNEFPSPPNNGSESKHGFTPRTSKTESVPDGRFA